MFFQFLIEDKSTEVLVRHVMKKMQDQNLNSEIYYDTKSFHGIGHLPKEGTPLERKTGQLLNDLPLYLRAFNKKFLSMKDVAIIVVLDNDMRNPDAFRSQLEDLGKQNMILTDHVFCIAVKEMEAWLLGDMNAILSAYPEARISARKDYIQDGICDTWETLANMVYPGGLTELKKEARNSYTEIGKIKNEWADRIGQMLELNQNESPSFQRLIHELMVRIQVA